MYSSASAKTHLKTLYGTDVEELIGTVCRMFSAGDPEFADRLFGYAMNGWLKFSSAILMAAKDERAMPIACFLTHVDDTVESLVEHVSEVSRITVRGGGLSGDWSRVRPPNLMSPGPIGFMNVVNSAIKVFRQGITRRGNYAAYMTVSHPSIYEFVQMRIPGGDPDRKNLNLHHAVNVTDDFMDAVRRDRDWKLICPKSGRVSRTIKARELWELILETRYRTGEPYINFIDTVNRANPEFLKAQGYDVRCSNLCNEIHLPTGTDLTAVCCLSSLNLAAYDEWETTSLVEDVVEMLDNVIQYFIDAAPPALKNAVNGAALFRPLGLGVLGLAQLYQKRNLVFDSEEAAALNKSIFASLKEKAVRQSFALGAWRGEPPALIGTGRRNSHLLAVAPTTNSATLLNTSPSIEPWPANAYTNRTKSGSVLIKNPELEKLLDEKNKNTNDVWQRIILDEGSVQRLDFLSAHEKAVFKTAYEVDPFQILRQAGDRQHHICQGQALSLFLPKDVEKKTMHRLHFYAWQMGCKGLYYIRTKTIRKVETIVEECGSCGV